ncbi:MAG TPA: pantetheine-phosphate adenylyltransferase, partial [Cyclobacteriaceae bacterium]|nr:pantetheine-phosphate adenylyltransferase [Cyclobacteriaceae bacterium]
MKKIAVFPGSFDPITIGHVDIINRGLPLFDKLIIGIGVNSQKKYLFPIERRVGWIKKIYEFEPKIEVETYNGLTVNFCELRQATYILRGIRSSGDFEFERAVSQTNRVLSRNIETIFILANPSLAAVSSSIVRDVIVNGG